MKKVTKTIATLSIAALVYLTGCSESPTEPKSDSSKTSFSHLRSEALIDLPSAIAKTEATKRRKMESENGEALEIYEGVRDFVGFANEIVHNEEFGIEAQIETWKENLDWNHIEEVGTFTHTDKEEKVELLATFDTTREFAYQLILKKLEASKSPIAFQIDFNGDFTYPAGKTYYNLGLLGEKDEKIEILADFAQTDTAKTLNINITNNSVSTETDEIGALQLSLKEVDGNIHMSGCASFPNMTGIREGVVGHSYVFTGTANETDNQAIIKLGLPHATYDKNDESLFTTYGIAEVFMNHFIETEIANLNDTIKSIIITSYKENLTVEAIIGKVTLGDTAILHDASEITTMTQNDFITFLTLNKEISDVKAKSDFAHLLWIAELTQPVYFDNGGYAGNGDVAPEKFQKLAAIKSQLAPFVPNDVTNLSITVE